nr:ankyrin repeat-containing protein [Tanacetum cinerariifolium]
MDSKSSELGSTHVLDIMSQEEEHKINVANSTPGTTMPVSEPGSTDYEPNTRINNESTSVPPQPDQRKLACFDLINGSKEEYLQICIPLYEAAITSDWESAKVILDKRPELVRYAITDGGDTILHIAVSAEDIIMAEIFVNNLLDRMESEDLETKNCPGDIALTLAVAKGSILMFELMLNKHKALLSINRTLTLGALSSSTEHGNLDMALYFYNVLEKMRYVFWTDLERCFFIIDIALKVLVAYPNIATSTKFCKYSLVTLARSPDAFNTTEPNMISRITDPFFAFFHTKNSFPEKDNEALNLLITILKLYPRIDKPRIIDEMVPDFNEQGSKKGGLVVTRDTKNNTMLHLVGKTSNKFRLLQTVSGASILMQRELLWFKEVERMIPPYMRYIKNNQGKTAYELFSENNQELVSKGLKWTKDCMVVTALIITVAFAVAFTVPGGYDQETGIPIFNPETSFLVFMIADGVSLFSSSTSLLVFLSILTSPHGQHDFLYSLPKKLMIGLVTLFISVAAMMVTFAASFFVLYRNTHKWLPILISILAATPVIIFAALQYPLLMDMFRSMYDSSECGVP